MEDHEAAAVVGEEDKHQERISLVIPHNTTTTMVDTTVGTIIGTIMGKIMHPPTPGK